MLISLNQQKQYPYQESLDSSKDALKMSNDTNNDFEETAEEEESDSLGINSDDFKIGVIADKAFSILLFIYL